MCCLWRAHDEASFYTGFFPATHPGFAHAVPDPAKISTTVIRRNSTAQSCGITQPANKATLLNQFNPTEIPKNVTLQFKNYSIPAKRTTYVDLALNFPDDSADLFHIVEADAVVRNPDLLHHYVVRGCPTKWPEAMDGKEVSRQQSQHCKSAFGGWAPGKALLHTPPHLGQPLGRNVSVVAFVGTGMGR